MPCGYSASCWSPTTMGLFGTGQKPGKFKYRPRFYDDQEDEEFKRRMRVKRQANSRRSPSNLLYLLALLALTIYLYTIL